MELTEEPRPRPAAGVAGSPGTAHLGRHLTGHEQEVAVEQEEAGELVARDQRQLLLKRGHASGAGPVGSARCRAACQDLRPALVGGFAAARSGSGGRCSSGRG